MIHTPERNQELNNYLNRPDPKPPDRFQGDNNDYPELFKQAWNAIMENESNPPHPYEFYFKYDSEKYTDKAGIFNYIVSAEIKYRKQEDTDPDEFLNGFEGKSKFLMKEDLIIKRLKYTAQGYISDFLTQHNTN